MTVTWQVPVRDRIPSLVVTPAIVGHRGASGHRPEHTLEAYRTAIRMGVDDIEIDLVSTRDGVLVARHESELSGTTDVTDHLEFASRRDTRCIDGHKVTGWFTEDFTLAELKTLRAKERIPQLRPGNTRFDGMFPIPTLEEILALLKGMNAERARGNQPPIGIYPETKHPSYFAGIGLAMEAPLVAMLDRYGYRERGSPAFIQSFETGNLRRLARMTPLPLVQLMDEQAGPWDLAAGGDARTYKDLASPTGLKEIAAYAQAIGVNKNMLIGRHRDATLSAATSLIRDAHDAGLLVHAWTFRAENAFLPRDLRSSGTEADRGDVIAELRRFAALGLDGLFIDQPDLGVRALAQ